MKLALLALLAAPSVAFAEDFQVLDRGTSVEVIAHGVTAARTGVMPIRSRLEVPLVGHPRLTGLAPKDATVKVVELEDGNLSVKVGFEHPAVVSLAKFAQAIQVGPDLHLIFPRIAPADGTAFVLPEPTIPAELAKKVAATTAPAPVPPPAPAPIGPALPPKPIATPEPIAAAPRPAPTHAVEPKAALVTPETGTPESASPQKPVAKLTPEGKKPAEAKAPEDAWNKLAMYGAIGLVGIGIGGWLLKKKKKAAGPESSIEVIAQKSLGGKAKIVWFNAGGREMVVAVTPQAVRMLGQWQAGAKSERQLGNLTGVPEQIAAKGSSPAISGILKLREKAGPAFTPVNDDLASGDIDADALWAREILAATAGAKR